MSSIEATATLGSKGSALKRTFQRLRGGAAAVLLALPLLIGVPAQAATGSQTLPVTVPTPQPLEWSPCADQPDRDCAELSVPLDYNDPSGPQVNLPVARARATDPANRVGTLFYNPGGPGQPATGTVMFGDLAYMFSEEIAAKFDIVAFDPRGTSGNGILCQTAAQREEYWETDRLPQTPQELDQLLAQERQANQGCLAHSSPLVRHVDTASAVRDMEMLRRAMNIPKINFVGSSYGTFIGERYGDLYPNNVRALVLDAVVDRGVSDLRSFAESNSAYEAAWHSFKDWCAANVDCRLRGQNVDAVVDQILATARTTPIPAPYGPLTQRPVTEWIFSTMLQAAVAPGYITYGWAEEMIVKAAAGDASLARYIYDASTGFPPYFEGGDQHRAIVCEDTRWSQLLPTSKAVALLAAASKKTAPRFGETNVFAGPVQCVGFPVTPVEPPPLSMNSAGQPPVLLIAGSEDRSTPQVWAERVKQRQPVGSKLVVREGPGHVSMPLSRCVKDAATRYLVDLSLSGPTTCQTDEDLYPVQQVPILGPTARTSGVPAVPEVLATR